ncbi:MAG: hypothetical protein ACI4Q4_02940 [Oscillospiraceae bacterium]
MAKNIKTVTLDGSEQSVDIKGSFCFIRNLGDEMIFAGSSAGISPDADGVLPIAAGESCILPRCEGKVYLKGSGKAVLVGDDKGRNFIKPAVGGSADGADIVARNAIAAHSSNAAVHLTAQDISGLFAGTSLLMNSDFRINQRGETEYTSGYSVDRWRVSGGTAAVSDSGITLTKNAEDSQIEFVQKLEYSFSALAGRTMSVSMEDDSGTVYTATGVIPEQQPSETTPLIYAAGPTGVSAGISWSKGGYFYFRIWVRADSAFSVRRVNLELGEPTLFCPPNPAAELSRCKRYYQRITSGVCGMGFVGEDGTASVVIPASLARNAANTAALNGTAYLTTPTCSGDSAVEIESLSGCVFSDNCILVNVAAQGAAAGEPCFLELRNDSCIAISAEV